jgi:hypothetical protein
MLPANRERGVVGYFIDVVSRSRYNTTREVGKEKKRVRRT